VFEEKIFLDIDHQRIKDVLGAVYDASQDILDTEFLISKVDFVSKIDIYLNSNRITIPVAINLPSKKYPELLIEVNLRKKGAFARMGSRKKQAELNHYLNTL
jgi:hypothetical protein